MYMKGPGPGKLVCIVLGTFIEEDGNLKIFFLSSRYVYMKMNTFQGYHHSKYFFKITNRPTLMRSRQPSLKPYTFPALAKPRENTIPYIFI
jgi:hypothetical protein